MTRKSWISALALTTLLGAGIALPASASAQGYERGESVRVIKSEGRFAANLPRQHHSRQGQRHDGYSRGRGHKHGHSKHRYREVREVREVRHYYHERPVTVIERHHHRDSGVRIHIGYDFTL